MTDNIGDADTLHQLKQAQERVEGLKASGAEMNSPEAKRAVNRLVTLIRGATPDELALFDRWKESRSG